MKNRVTGWHQTSPWPVVATTWPSYASLVGGGQPSPLKNDGLRQLGWLFPYIVGKKKFQTTNQWGMSYMGYNNHNMEK